MDIAVIEKNKVVNVVVGDPDIVSQMFKKTHPVTEATGNPWIGARFNGEKFEPKQPYPSWSWDEESFSYYPPKPKPEGDYYWSEAEGDWLKIPEETEPTEEEK